MFAEFAARLRKPSFYLGNGYYKIELIIALPVSLYIYTT